MSDKNPGKRTLVEEGTEFKGSMSSSCPIVVMGKVEGDVTGPVIHVTPSGVVAGKVKVTQLESEGEIAGEVEADIVRISGRIRDKTVVRARTLEVSVKNSRGVEVMFGDCELAIGDEPDKAAAIAAALAPPAPAPASTPPDAKASTSQKIARRKGPSEASWDEAGSATTNAPTVTAEPALDEDGKPTRPRRTQPPPFSS